MPSRWRRSARCAISFQEFPARSPTRRGFFSIPMRITICYDPVSRLAVVALGYADGLLRAASATDTKAGGEAIASGRPCPIAGRISMDLLAIDVTDLPDETPRRGDLVALLDDTIGVDDLASHAGTI